MKLFSGKLTKSLSVLIVLLISAVTVSCSTGNNNRNSVAVFVPGIISDSPVYAMLADGVKEAVDEYNKDQPDKGKALVTILEAGTNQAEWSTKITSLAASGKYGVIISSNPSLPDIVEPLTKQFSAQKFILMDAYDKGNNNIATVRYNQREQSFVTGYIAALMSKNHKIGLISGQQYPVMDTTILPGYKEGAEAAVKDTVVDYRIVGNWYDASKGAELATAMYNSGADVILPICGGASQGVIASAKEHKFRIAWFDKNEFEDTPDITISSCVLRQGKMSKEMTLQYLEGKIQWGTAQTVGMKDGYVEFIQDDPAYIRVVPKDIRDKMAAIVKSIKDGKLILPQD